MFLTGGAAPFCSWRRTCRLAIFIGGPLQQYIDQKGASQKAQRCENDDVHGARRGGQRFCQSNPLANQRSATPSETLAKWLSKMP